MPEVRLQLNGGKLKPIGFSSATGWVATHDKAEKLLKYFGRLMQIEVEVDHRKHDWLVEIFVSAEHMLNFTGFRTSAIRPI